jgi:hypothetical protein
MKHILQIIVIITCMVYIVRVCIIKGDTQFIVFPLSIIAIQCILIYINTKQKE